MGGYLDWQGGNVARLGLSVLRRTYDFDVLACLFRGRLEAVEVVTEAEGTDERSSERPPNHRPLPERVRAVWRHELPQLYYR